MKVLIVDDEPLARGRLVRMLAKIPDVEVAGEAGDASEARAQVLEKRPDVLLLDIHLPEENGLELVASTPNLPPVIFTTAHDEHAVKAFELAAIDYLLKPIEAPRLVRALDRVRNTAREAPASEILRVMEKLAGGKQRVRISARSGMVVRIFDAESIARFVAADKYVLFHVEGQEMIVDESLNELEQRLSGLPFLRVHRKELINLDRVRALHTEGGELEVELDDGQRAQVSRRSVVELKARLGISR